MLEEIKQIDEKYIAIVETTTNERLVAKVTLETEKSNLTDRIAEIDKLLLLFVAPK